MLNFPLDGTETSSTPSPPTPVVPSFTAIQVYHIFFSFLFFSRFEAYLCPPFTMPIICPYCALPRMCVEPQQLLGVGRLALSHSLRSILFLFHQSVWCGHLSRMRKPTFAVERASVFSAHMDLPRSRSFSSLLTFTCFLTHPIHACAHDSDLATCFHVHLAQLHDCKHGDDTVPALLRRVWITFYCYSCLFHLIMVCGCTNRRRGLESFLARVLLWKSSHSEPIIGVAVCRGQAEKEIDGGYSTNAFFFYRWSGMDSQWLPGLG